MMQDALTIDIESIQGISAVPTILETVLALTGLCFVCIARVTSDTWTTCAVLDKLGLGLKVGDGLDVTTTLCQEIRDSSAAIIIDSVSTDDIYCNHQTPKLYGFQSYFSIPIFRLDDEYFGTLCGLDPEPAKLSIPAIASTMTLFADLISRQLNVEQHLKVAQEAFQAERHTAELREQFIAVLGHDLRTPLGAIINGIEILKRQGSDPRAALTLERMKRSVDRISALIDDVVDFTRGRIGGGISVDLKCETNLHIVFEQVRQDIRAIHPLCNIKANVHSNIELLCAASRMGQLLSNLLKNAVVHGKSNEPVLVSAVVTHDLFELVVTNSNAQIPEEIVSQFFKPFWRGLAQPGGDGIGLGLFIVAEIARSHGATIDVVTSDTTTSFVYKAKNAALHERRLMARSS